MTRLLTPRDWQQEALAKAVKWVGTTEAERYMVEARRYGLMADYIELVDRQLEACIVEVRETRELVEKILDDQGE